MPLQLECNNSKKSTRSMSTEPEKNTFPTRHLCLSHTSQYCVPSMRMVSPQDENLSFSLQSDV